MQPEGPYRFTHALGGSPVGKAWAAIDEQGRFVTVAVLEATVAATPGWREAFAGAADLLAQSPDPVPYTYADFSAAAPWVAYPAEAGPGAEKLFRALGVDYTPAPMAAPPTSAPPSVSAPPVSAPPQPVSGGPQAPWAVQTGPIPGQLVSATPHPISGVPVSPAAVTSAPPAAHISPVSGPSADTFVPPVRVPPHDPFSSPAQRIRPSQPRPRRTGLWIGIAALVVALVGGGTAFALTGFEGKAEPTASPTPTGVVESGATGSLPTAPPQQPGLEPPRPGDWPKWPVFVENGAVRAQNPDGLGFKFLAPANWECAPGGSAEGQIEYNCGASIGENSEIGGELIVRDCRDCKEEQRDALRKAEEAWGLQWRSAGPYVVLAETVKLNGAQRYGIVVVAFWRSDPDGAIDRQLVLRMTAPSTYMNDIRRVVNSVRDNARF
ncbi:hypothetical protein [Micromonospora sp. LH3U1]|uniref:hypothetical protein n=1 Tax=Micromonospora sp. LH3U1 TaxID=3018339 RepID=UPI002349A876|nr:hypothetical protein [Micromonospora sp. LH3U1]WCN82601.1 hypothetical protein PCA76_05860 [Micromonospora sp. LH3U1]